MTTSLYPSPVFGPVRSRRLGVSLGVNLLPADRKVCSVDCLYCECGLNAQRRGSSPFPTREEVREALRSKLQAMSQEGIRPDVITFAGNGEPTLHKEFPLIVDDVIGLRNELCPEAKISVLSNSTTLPRPDIRRALMLTDNPIMKLDTVCDDYIRHTDRPTGHYSVSEIIAAMKLMEGKAIVQTMFMSQEQDGRLTDNTAPSYVLPWLEALREINPRQVMIYTIDRPTPISTLRKVSPEALDSVATMVRQAGFPCTVSY